MIEFLLENWKALIAPLLAILTWIFKTPLAKWTLRQNKADIEAVKETTKSTTIDNLEKSMNIYIAMLDDVKRRLEAKEKELEKTYKEIEFLRKELDRIKKELENCK